MIHIDCKRCCLTLGSLIPFLLTKKVGWLSLPRKEEEANDTTTIFVTTYCLVFRGNCSPICCWDEFYLSWGFIHFNSIFDRTLTLSGLVERRLELREVTLCLCWSRRHSILWIVSLSGIFLRIPYTYNRITELISVFYFVSDWWRGEAVMTFPR